VAATLAHTKQWIAGLRAASKRYELVLRATLLMFAWFCLTTPAGLAIKVCSLIAFVWPHAVTNRYVWTGISGLFAWYIGGDRFLHDNHMYLYMWWAFACTGSLWLAVPKDRAEFLRRNSQALIGLAFGFATFWKLWGGQYIDGGFLTFYIRTNRDTTSLLNSLGILPNEVVDQNMKALSALILDPGIRQCVVAGTPAADLLAKLVAWWTILIEFAVAASFLIRLPLRNYVMAIFVVSTYFFLPIYGFCCCLIVMTYAQLEGKAQRWQMVVLGLFLAMVMRWLLVPGLQ